MYFEHKQHNNNQPLNLLSHLWLILLDNDSVHKSVSKKCFAFLLALGLFSSTDFDVFRCLNWRGFICLCTFCLYNDIYVSIRLPFSRRRTTREQDTQTRSVITRSVCADRKCEVRKTDGWAIWSLHMLPVFNQSLFFTECHIHQHKDLGATDLYNII